MLGWNWCGSHGFVSRFPVSRVAVDIAVVVVVIGGFGVVVVVGMPLAFSR